MRHYQQNMNRIEIEISTACNLRCRQCDRSSAQAITDENMTVEQVGIFVHESINMGWLWYEIELLGGEPTLHPEFSAVLKCLQDYLRFNPDCTVILVSNGYGARVQELLATVPSNIKIENTKKQHDNTIPFSSYNLAPLDDSRFTGNNFERGCRIASECGIGLTRYGYYLCGAGASVDRVFGFDIGIKALSELCDETLFPQRTVLCRLCGHFKPRELKVRNAEEISESWRIAYANFRTHKPKLTLLGCGEDEA